MFYTSLKLINMLATRTQKTRQMKLDRDWSDFLIDGNDFFLLPHGEKSDFRMWELHREMIMDLWNKFKPFILNDWTYPCSFGNRPFGWWLFEAPEKERRHLGGYKLVNDMGLGLYFGLRQRFPVNLEILKDPPRYETSLQYLSRLNLLTKYEKKCMDRGDKYIGLHDFKIPVERLKKFFI